MTRWPTTIPVSSASDQPTVPAGKRAWPPVKARRKPAPSTKAAAATIAAGNAGQTGWRSVSAPVRSGPRSARRRAAPCRTPAERAVPGRGVPKGGAGCGGAATGGGTACGTGTAGDAAASPSAGVCGAVGP